MEILNCKDCAKFLNRTEAAVRNLVLRRAIPYRKAGGRLVFIKQEVEEWITTSPGLTLDDSLKFYNER